MKNWQATTQHLFINLAGGISEDLDAFVQSLAAFCPDIYGMAMDDRDVRAVIETDRHVYLRWD